MLFTLRNQLHWIGAIRMIKLGYDAGHSINTPGKRTPDNEREWRFNDTVATAFASELAKYDGINLKRFDDVSGETDVALNTRTTNANTWGARYYISFHHNALAGKWGTHTGVETFIYTTPKADSEKFAHAVHSALVKGYGLRDRGVKKQNLAIVRDIKCATILVEGGFMDSTIDIKVLRDKKKLDNTGRLIAYAVAQYLGLKKKVVEDKETVADWANDAVEWAKKNNISDGTYLKRLATREEVLTMIYNASKVK